MKKLILILFLLSGCAAFPAEENLPLPIFQAEEPAEWQTVPVSRGDVIHDTVMVPVFSVETRETLRFAESGLEIEGIYISEGDEVTARQVLASLKNPELDTLIETARRNQERLILQLQHLEERNTHALRMAEFLETPFDDLAYLNEKENITEQLYFLRLEIDYLMELDEARLIRAPFNGVVRNVLVFFEGQISSSNATVAILEDMDKAFFRVQHYAAEQINPGDKFEMTLSNDAATVQVEVIDPAEHGLEEPLSGSVRIWFQVSGGHNMLFESGTIGRIYHVYDTATNVISVPSRALRTASGREFVFVMENGIRRMRFVETGIRAINSVEIISGLEEGELVVI